MPFFLQPVTMDLVKEHAELIAAIRLSIEFSGGRRARYAQP